MTVHKLALMTLCAGALAVTACTSPVQSLPPGEYEKTTKTTNSNGTDYKTNTKTTVTEDQYGNRKATIQKETTTDPKGLFNKSTTKSTTTVR